MSPGIIAIAVVVVAALVFAAYHFTMGGGSSQAKSEAKWSKPLALPGQTGGGLKLPNVPPPPTGGVPSTPKLGGEAR